MEPRFAIAVIASVIVLSAFVPAVRAADSTSTPTPAIYDTLADTHTQISEALEFARQSDRNVLIQWGANWCVWCRLLHGMLTSDSLVNATLESNYVWVLADVGVKGKNANLLKTYGVDRKQGIPFLTVLDTSGVVLANQDTGVLETGDKEIKGHDREKVLAFLKAHAPQ